MAKTKVLGLCGSLRAESWNLKLLRNFLSSLDPESYSTTLFGPLDLPLMNEDLEKLPLHARILQLRDAMKESPIVVLASPEYNSSLSPALKNAIDWASRGPANLWLGKICVILSASPGALGGARGLIHLRAVLANNKSWIIPEQVQCSAAHEAFDASGALKNEFVMKQMKAAADSLGAFSRKMLS